MVVDIIGVVGRVHGESVSSHFLQIKNIWCVVVKIHHYLLLAKGCSYGLLGN